MDKDLKTLYDYLCEENITQLAGNVKDAAYRISVDPVYADLANNIRNVLDYIVMDENMEDHTSIGIDDYKKAAEEIAKYEKETAFAEERVDFDDALDLNQKDELERIIMKYKEQYEIDLDLSEIKNNIVRYSNDLEAIDLENENPYNSFYHDCVSEYIGEKQDSLDKNNINAKSLSYVNPDTKYELKNAGYINLLFAAIILTAIAFFILFKIF